MARATKGRGRRDTSQVAWHTIDQLAGEPFEPEDPRRILAAVVANIVADLQGWARAGTLVEVDEAGLPDRAMATADALVNAVASIDAIPDRDDLRSLSSLMIEAGRELVGWKGDRLDGVYDPYRAIRTEDILDRIALVAPAIRPAAEAISTGTVVEDHLPVVKTPLPEIPSMVTSDSRFEEIVNQGTFEARLYDGTSAGAGALVEWIGGGARIHEYRRPAATADARPGPLRRVVVIDDAGSKWAYPGDRILRFENGAFGIAREIDFKGCFV